MVRIRKVDTFPGRRRPGPSRIRATGTVFLYLNYSVVQDVLKKVDVPLPGTLPRLEPIVPRLAFAFPHVDEEPVGGFHFRRIGRNLDAEQLVVKLNEFVSDSSRPGRVRGTRFDYDAQPGKLITGLIGPGNDVDEIVPSGGNLNGDTYRAAAVAERSDC